MVKNIGTEWLSPAGGGAGGGVFSVCTLGMGN